MFQHMFLECFVSASKISMISELGLKTWDKLHLLYGWQMYTQWLADIYTMPVNFYISIIGAIRGIDSIIQVVSLVLLVPVAQR